MSGLTVIKLGGSHAGSPHLRPWLDAISKLAGSVVLVPGGGPFADAVRDAQPEIGFDDRAAHRMALLAMGQYAHALASLCPLLQPAESEAEIRRALVARHVPAWCPERMALADPGIAESWDVTSDSLALWLAGKLVADRVVLVKMVDPAELPDDVESLSRAGVVDAAFPSYHRTAGVETWIAGPSSEGALAGGPGLLRLKMRAVARLSEPAHG